MKVLPLFAITLYLHIWGVLNIKKSKNPMTCKNEVPDYETMMQRKCTDTFKSELVLCKSL